MGRPVTIPIIDKKEVEKLIMTEKEQEIFIQYLNWNSNRDVTKAIGKSSTKAINSKIGRYSNKFLHNEWVHKSKGYTEYTLNEGYQEIKRGKLIKKQRKITKKQRVPIYRANFEFIFPYISMKNHKSKAYLLSEEAQATINLFFELDCVRDILKACFHFRNVYGYSLYSLVEEDIQEGLIGNWLVLNGSIQHKLFEVYRKMFLIFPRRLKLQNQIMKFRKSKVRNTDTVEERKKIITEFENNWQKCLKGKHLKHIVNAYCKTRHLNYDEGELFVKTRFWAFHLYDKKILHNISEVFLSPMIARLIEQQRKTNQN